MSPDRFARLEALYDEASSLPVEAREARLARLSAAEPDLAAEVRALLDAPTDDLEDELRTLAAACDDAHAGETAIGPYRLMGTLGEGGFGVVHLAEQRTPVHRLVALKVIKPGMDTKTVLSRFRHELQAMGAMSHPSIPAVLDAGETEDHRPYVVMPLVPGRSITAFASEQRLSTEARVRLVLEACRGVQHAHARGVIHRDLKPDNILVTLDEGTPRPAIIDFGLAKAMQTPLTEHSTLTIAGQVLGTPEYMSPEQADCSPDIDVRTDVYSLGCILYELLAGRPPFTPAELRANGRDGMIRTLTSHDPAAPSKWSSVSLARELDWICLRCLEKAPGRRYATVESLANDLQRFLDGKAVEAGPADDLYRMRRWAARHRAFVAASLLAATGLLSGLLLAINYANASRRSAERAAEVSRITREILTSVDPRVAQGRDPELLLEMLARSERVFENSTLSPEVELELRETFATAYRSAGAFQQVGVHARRADQLIIAAEGKDSLRRLPMLRSLLTVFNNDTRPPEQRGSRASLEQELVRIASLDASPGATTLLDARVHVARLNAPDPEACRSLLSDAERIAGPESTSAIVMMRVLARRLGETGHYPTSPLFVEARRRAVAALGPDDPLVHDAIGMETYALFEDGSDAEHARPVIEFCHEHLADAERVLGWRHNAVATAIQNYASALMFSGRIEEAVAQFEKALDREIRIRGAASNLGAWIRGTLCAAAVDHHLPDIFERHEPELWHAFPDGAPVQGEAEVAIIRGLHQRGLLERRDRWLKHLRTVSPELAESVSKELGL
jgi:Protein kinase domain